MLPSNPEALQALGKFHLRKAIKYSLYLSTITYSPVLPDSEPIFSILPVLQICGTLRDCCLPWEMAANRHGMPSASPSVPPAALLLVPPFIPPTPSPCCAVISTRGDLFWALPHTICYKGQYQRSEHQNMPNFSPSSSEHSRVPQISSYQESAEGQC